jgi:CubicO group peptidase (beta-lactamase class C family)
MHVICLEQSITRGCGLAVAALSETEHPNWPAIRSLYVKSRDSKAERRWPRWSGMCSMSPELFTSIYEKSKMIRATVILFLAISSTIAHDGARADKTEASRDLHEQVDQVFAKWDSTTSPGCALSVIKDGQIIYKRGYGMADLDHDVPINAETVFHVASVSKQFTAAAIILLAQERKISLDDEVRKYVTELPDFGTPITIRQLIYHTSGLRDQWALLGLAGWRYSLDLITDDDVLELISRQKELNFKPGEQHVYCNTGYTLLAQIVKRVSGQSFRDFTSKRIFMPLDMKSTQFRDDHAEVVKHIAYGYVEGEGGKGYRLSVTNFDTVGATSLLTTVEDLAQWDENFYHPRVGGPELVTQQLERGKLNSGKELNYAFGLEHSKYRGLHTVDHGGADAGYRADLLRFPEQHFSVACLCNKGEINPGELTRKVADIYLAEKFTEPPPLGPQPSEKPVVVSAERLAKYAGLYWKNDDKRAARIVLKDGKPFLAFSKDDRLELAALSDNRFRLVVYPVSVTFSEPTAGAPQQMTIQAPEDEKPEVFDLITQAKPTPNQLAFYAGSYVSQEIDPVYRIVVDDGALVLKRLKAKSQKLEPILEDDFQARDGNIRFEKDAAGTITGFVLDSGRIKNFHFKKTTQM